MRQILASLLVAIGSAALLAQALVKSEAHLYVYPHATYQMTGPLLIPQQTVQRAMNTCAKVPKGKVCVDVWVVDPATNIGLNGVTVRVAGQTAKTTAGGDILLTVNANQTAAFDVIPPTGYGSDPGVHQHPIGTDPVLVVWELIHQ